ADRLSLTVTKGILVEWLSIRGVKGSGRRASFSALVRLVSQANGVNGQEFIRAGRKRQWVRSRSMLDYLAREWGRISVKELGRRLHRDPSIISRLYAAYATNRDTKAESRCVRRLQQ